MLRALCAKLFLGDRMADMEAAQKDLGNDQGTIQNQGKKRVCREMHLIL